MLAQRAQPLGECTGLQPGSAASLSDTMEGVCKGRA